MHAAESSGYKFDWSYKLPDDGNDRFWDCIAYLPESKTLAAIEIEREPQAKGSKFTLWEFSVTGNVLRQTVFEKKGAAQIMPGKMKSGAPANSRCATSGPIWLCII